MIALAQHLLKFVFIFIYWSNLMLINPGKMDLELFLVALMYLLFFTI